VVLKVVVREPSVVCGALVTVKQSLLIHIIFQLICKNV